MRRVVTTLVLLLVVIVAGLGSLVLLVNPNDFKQNLIEEVANESGYKLTITGSLRWHVWPKLSVLGAAITLQAPETKLPLLIANNVRFDVALIPLLSHRLSINQVVLRNAILQMVPDSLASVRSGQVIATNLSDNVPILPSIESFYIKELALIDSLVVWQDPRGNQVNFRETNLNIKQTHPQQGTFSFSSQINHNQQQLNLSLQGSFDARRYLGGIALLVEEGAYHCSGLALPARGIAGKLAFNGLFSPNDLGFKISKLQLSANDNQFNGNLNGHLADTPVVSANLHSEQLNINAFFDNTEFKAPVVASEQRAASQEIDPQFNDPWLLGTSINLNLLADEVSWNSLKAKQLQLQTQLLNNKLSLHNLSGQISPGQFVITGSINLQTRPAEIHLSPKLTNFPLNQLLQFVDLPQAFSGQLDLSGRLTSQGGSVANLLRSGLGQMEIKLKAFDSKRLDLNSIVTNAVLRNSDLVEPMDNQVETPELVGSIQLTPGEVKIQQLVGENEKMQLSGKGVVDLTSKRLDVLLAILIKHWRGNAHLVQLLSSQTVPLRLYGEWDDLHYQMPINEILKTDLHQDLKNRLDHWLNKNSNDGIKNRSTPSHNE